MSSCDEQLYQRYLHDMREGALAELKLNAKPHHTVRRNVGLWWVWFRDFVGLVVQMMRDLYGYVKRKE